MDLNIKSKYINILKEAVEEAGEKKAKIKVKEPKLKP